MKLTAFSSIGGLSIIGTAPGGKEQLRLRVAREDISDMAVSLIQEIGMDASPKLIAKCRELIDAVDGDMEAANPGRKKFIQQLEDNAGECKRSDETDEQYFERLQQDYPEIWARHRI